MTKSRTMAVAFAIFAAGISAAVAAAAGTYVPAAYTPHRTLRFPSYGHEEATDVSLHGAHAPLADAADDRMLPALTLEGTRELSSSLAASAIRRLSPLPAWSTAGSRWRPSYRHQHHRIVKRSSGSGSSSSISSGGGAEGEGSSTAGGTGGSPSGSFIPSRAAYNRIVQRYSTAAYARATLNGAELAEFERLHAERNRYLAALKERRQLLQRQAQRQKKQQQQQRQKKQGKPQTPPTSSSSSSSSPPSSPAAADDDQAAGVADSDAAMAAELDALNAIMRNALPSLRRLRVIGRTLAIHAGALHEDGSIPREFPATSPLAPPSPSPSPSSSSSSSGSVSALRQVVPPRRASQSPQGKRKRKQQQQRGTTSSSPAAAAAAFAPETEAVVRAVAARAAPAGPAPGWDVSVVALVDEAMAAEAATGTSWLQVAGASRDEKLAFLRQFDSMRAVLKHIKAQREGRGEPGRLAAHEYGAEMRKRVQAEIDHGFTNCVESDVPENACLSKWTVRDANGVAVFQPAFRGSGAQVEHMLQRLVDKEYDACIKKGYQKMHCARLCTHNFYGKVYVPTKAPASWKRRAAAGDGSIGGSGGADPGATSVPTTGGGAGNSGGGAGGWTTDPPSLQQQPPPSPSLSWLSESRNALDDGEPRSGGAEGSGSASFRQGNAGGDERSAGAGGGDSNAWDDEGKGSGGRSGGTTAFDISGRAVGATAGRYAALSRPPPLARMQRGAESYLLEAVQSGGQRAARALQDAWTGTRPLERGSGDDGDVKKSWWRPRGLMHLPEHAYRQLASVGRMQGATAPAQTALHLGRRW